MSSVSRRWSTRCGSSQHLWCRSGAYARIWPDTRRGHGARPRHAALLGYHYPLSARHAVSHRGQQWRTYRLFAARERGHSSLKPTTGLCAAGLFRSRNAVLKQLMVKPTSSSVDLLQRHRWSCSTPLAPPRGCGARSSRR